MPERKLPVKNMAAGGAAMLSQVILICGPDQMNSKSVKSKA